MKNLSALQILFRALRKSVVAMPAILIFFSGCTHNHQANISGPVDDPYNADNLAKDWREQVRKNPHNPYEGRSNIYPTDNDSDYYYPGKHPLKAPRSPAPTPQPPQNPAYRNPGYNNNPGYNSQQPVEDNDDSYYGKFPRYNPDDDNVYTNSKEYPLYLD